eukprot:gene9615-11308_t
MDCEEPEETISKLSDWFTSVCKFQPPLAHQLASELVNSCGITGYEQFPVLQQADPNWLNNLECSIPTLAKILVKVNVEKIGRTPLRSLDLEDVRGILEACYAEFPYGQIFKEKQISGFNLSYVEKVEELKAFGITNDIHAMTLFASVTEWKRVGVPNELIDSNTLRNVHIKEEAYREVSRARNASRSASPEPVASSVVHADPLEDSVQQEVHHSSEDERVNQVEMETSSSAVEGAENNPVVINSSSSSSCSSSSTSAEGDTEAGRAEQTAETTTHLDAYVPSVPSVPSGTRHLEEEAMEVDAMEEAPETQHRIPDTFPTDHEERISTETVEDIATHRAHSPFGTVPITSAVRMDPSTSSASSATSSSTGSAVTAETSPILATFETLSEQAPAEPKARVQVRSISEAKQQPPGKPAPRKGTGRKKMTARKAPVKPTINTAITYNEHYNGRPLPGMPQHALLQAQYATIAQKMGHTQVNIAVAVTEHEAEMLRALPEQLIGGRWITKNTDDTESSYGCMMEYDTIKHSEQRENSLVFVPSARLATEEAIASVKPPKHAKIQPSAEYMIVIIVSSPEERKKRAMEGSRLFHPDSPMRPPRVRSGNARESSDGENEDGAASSPSSGSEASDVVPATTRRSTNNNNRKRARSPSVQDEEEGSERNEYSLRQRPKRSSAGVKGAILDLQAQELQPRRGARSVSSASASVAGSERSSAGLSSPPAGSARRHSSAGESSRSNVISPSSSHTSAGASVTRKATGRHSLGATSSSTGTGAAATATATATATASSKNKGAKTVSSACHDIMHSRDNQDLINGVNFLGTATSKSGREAVDYIVKSGTYQRLLHFIHLASQLPSIFVYYVLRTVSLIVTRLDGLAEIEIIFENNRFKDIVKLCTADNDFVREQSLHLVSEIGVGEEHGLKQRVLNAGAVQAIIECYNNVECFSNPKTASRIQGQCARSLYKLASMSTPKQFPVFVPALRVLHDVLLNQTCSWVFVVEAAQAVSFLVMPDQPRQIEVLMEHDLLNVLVAIFQDHTRNSGLRWHASIFVWSIAKHCSNAQMRKLFRLMGILGNVCHTDDAHPHLRAAALNIMQVMLQRGDFIIQQFVYHRDKIPTNVMDLLCAHKHKQLVHGVGRSSNCIIKYASFTLAHAVIGANKDQLLKLLDLGAYPLLFKIISLEGELDKPEEVKLLGISALSHILQEAPTEIRVTHDREAHKRANPTAVADAWWAVVRGLVEDTAEDEDDLSLVHDPANSVPEASRCASPSVGASAGTGAGTSASAGGAGSSSSSFNQLGVRRAVTTPKNFLWSEELREKAQVVIDMAHEVGLL